MTNPKVAICIVSYRRASLTQRCIESVRATASLPYHIFLADNGSPDTVAQTLLNQLEKATDITLLRLNQNFGPAIGRNVILADLPKAFQYIALFDNDIVALPGWDSAAVHALNAGADLIQPKLIKADRRTLERGPNRPNTSPLAANPEFIGRDGTADDFLVNQETDVAIVGGTSIIRRSVFDRIGLLDERLHIAEDFDFSLRARAAGFTLRYIPDCVLIHDHSFDFEYDQERGEVEKHLTTHVVFWCKWRKALLSPAYLAWYSWLYRHAEPMYLPTDQRWQIAHRRLCRRLVRKWIMSRYANYWKSTEDVEKSTIAIAAHINPNLIKDNT